MKRFQNILVVQEDDNGEALAAAARLARRNDAALKVVRVVPDLPTSIYTARSGVVFDLEAAISAESREVLEALVEKHADGVSADIRIHRGKPFVEVLREVMRFDHDLVIKSAAPVELGDRVFGSLDLHLVRKCPCPVWLLSESAGSERRSRVMAAVNLSHEDQSHDQMNRLIIELAASQARRMHAVLDVVAVWSLPGESMLRGPLSGMVPDEIDDLFSQTEFLHQKRMKSLLSGAEMEEVAYETHLIKGEATEVLDGLIRDNGVNLLVMGTMSHTGLAGFFIGSTAETILERLPASVMTVKPPGFICPVDLS